MNNKIKKENNVMPVVLSGCRIILALVFIFSGFVKAIDPLGLTYKTEDYLTAFGGGFLFFKPYAFYLAIAQSSFELLLGLNLLFKVHIKCTSILVLLFMLAMTPLTLYLALYNPVSDCGCFGDALKITNWQTFYKNIFLLLLAILPVLFIRKSRKLFLPHIEWILFVVFLGTGIGISLYAYNHLPMIDFLPYKIGVNIPSAMYVPDNAPTDKFETTFIYEKNGEKKEFTLENYPKDDSTWVFVDQKTVVVKEGYKAPIHDLHITDSGFNEITDQIIYGKGTTWLLIMYDLNQASITGAQKAQKIFERYKNTNMKFYAVTASGEDDIKAFQKKTGVTYPFCNADPTTLKTMIRANPGLIRIENSVITGKWHWHDFE